MVNVTVVATVKNEENTILQLLNSLENQSVKPSEVIIVDGGSKDKTVEIVKSFTSPRESFKLLLAEDANRSKGRNIGIAAAGSEIIACTDAGVTLDKFWLENLIKPFTHKDVDFVGGVYVQSGEKLLQQCIGILQYPNIEALRADDFLPSSRSVAFRKEVWKTVSGYPEHLEKAEDTYFDLKIKEKGFRTALAKDAVVSMPARDSLKSLFEQYSSYAEWDVRAKLFSRLGIYRLMILAYASLALLLLCVIVFGFWGFLFSLLAIIGYLAFSGFKAFRKTGKILSFSFGIAIKIIIFSAETVGILKGFVARISRE
jgi:glycosyltransferase involved in cell wall biosynthesis